MHHEWVEDLVKLADYFDKQGLTAEASVLDSIIKKAVYMNDTEQKMKQGMSPEEKEAFENALTAIDDHGLAIRKEEFDLAAKAGEWQIAVYNWIKAHHPEKLASVDHIDTKIIRDALAATYK